MVKIVINNIEINCKNIQNAINALYKIQKQQTLLKSKRCHKCIYLKETCGQTDEDGMCWKYRQNPLDGDYYG